MSLFLVATPIGNLGDMTFRAVDTLKTVDRIACEDTRVTAKLLLHFQIKKPLISYHDHNAQKIRPYLIHLLLKGEKIALVSDAGTPLISDPGYKLVSQCYEKNISVTCIPGASSILPALLLSNLPPHPFIFCGFFKNNASIWKKTPATLLFFESASRLLKTLVALKEHLSSREVAVVREITKLYEECVRGSFDEVIDHYVKKPPKGEIVIVLGPCVLGGSKKELNALLKNPLQLKKTDLTKQIMKETGLKREEVYKILLSQQDYS